MIYDIIKSGKRICQLRTQNGYTQEGLAKTLNIDRSNLSRIESGKRGCSLELLVQLSILFNVTLDYLVLDRDRTDTLGVDTKANLKGDIEALIRQLETFRSSL